MKSGNGGVVSAILESPITEPDTIVLNIVPHLERDVYIIRLTVDGYERFHRAGGWNGYTRRVDRLMLPDLMRHIEMPLQIYVCGPDGFVEAVANALLGLNVAPAIIHTERFGPSGPLTSSVDTKV